jgi:hypothetical protein
VKFIEKKFVDKNDLQLLAREIEIMKRVDHDNVKTKNPSFHINCKYKGSETEGSIRK